MSIGVDAIVSCASIFQGIKKAPDHSEAVSLRGLPPFCPFLREAAAFFAEDLLPITEAHFCISRASVAESISAISFSSCACTPGANFVFCPLQSRHRSQGAVCVCSSRGSKYFSPARTVKYEPENVYSRPHLSQTKYVPSITFPVVISTSSGAFLVCGRSQPLYNSTINLSVRFVKRKVYEKIL